MRVLILSQHYWPESFAINEVVSSLADAGCTVTVLTGKPNYPDGQIFPGYRIGGLQREQHEGREVLRVPLLPRGRGGALRLALNYLSFLFSALLLGPWLLRGRSFEVVFVYGTSPILQAIPAIALRRIKRAALVTWVQDLWPESLAVTGYVRSPTLLAAVAAVVRWIYRRSDLLLVQSHAFLQPVSAMAGGTPVAYHPNPSTLDLGDASAPALKPGFNIVFAGNLGTVQGLETVLDAAAIAGAESGIRWVLVGSGARSDWLADQLTARGLHWVELAGRFEPSAMPALFAQADALLVSQSRGPSQELTVPSKVQSYLAAGRPILASLDGEGARVVVEAGAGLCCPAGDAPALAAAALHLRDMGEAGRVAMGASGRRYHAEHFEPALLAQALIAHFRQAVARRESHT